MAWEKTVALADLAEKPHVFKSGPRQLVLLQAGGQFFAIDNRCPHEGYPLAEGTVDDSCVLTCNWHNWKFRLSDGECVLGGDHVRAYPVRTEDDFLWVDLSDPPPEVIESRILEGLRTAYDERDFGRICREVTRLHFNKLDPRLGVRKAIEWSYDKFEFGMTHAYAAAADWLAEAARQQDDWESQLICLSEPIDHSAFDALRHRQYPYGEPTEFTSAGFAEAVESQANDRAEGMVRAAMEAGNTWSDFEADIAAAALAHFNDFGHSLIYVYKTRQLVQLLGDEVTQYLAPCLARSISYATREDLIPEFSAYEGSLRELQPIGDTDAIIDAPFPASVRQALDFVSDNAQATSVRSLYDALLIALSKNLLFFDTTYGAAVDKPVQQSVGWLNFTHGITFANAVRAICEDHPHLWPAGLLQMALFVGRNHGFLDLEIDESKWLVEDADAFFAEARDIILDHGHRDPIFSAHYLKTTVAVEEELEFASGECQRYLLASLNRFLHSPIKQKHVRRLARQAIDLVQRDFR